MRRIHRIAVYLLIVGVVSAFGIWFCGAEVCKQIHELLFRYRVFSVFRGHKEFCINLLMGISTSALFASLGFYIDYFTIKKEVEEELIKVYRYLQKRCFKRVFCEKNSFDDDPVEVSSINDYLADKFELVKDYRPFCLVMHAGFSRFLRRFKKCTVGDKNQKIGIYEYISSNKYALICNIIAELKVYFTFIECMQSSIADCDHTIKLCDRLIKQSTCEEYEIETLKTYLVISKKEKEGYRNRLISRFPYNTKEYQRFLDKRITYSKIMSINVLIGDQYFTSQMTSGLLLKQYIAEDEHILYDESDPEIRLIFSNEDIQKEKEAIWGKNWNN